MSVINTYNFYLDSEYASKTEPGEVTEVTFFIRKPITLRRPGNHFRIRINSAEIPLAFNQVNASNNSFQVAYVAAGGAVTSLGTATIPSGTYNINDLITQFCNNVNVLLPVGKSIAGAYTPATGHVLLTLTDPAVGKLRLSSDTTILFEMLGRDETATQIEITTLGSDSTQNVNVAPVTAIYVSSRSFTQTQNYEALTSGFDLTDVIGKLQITTLPQTFLMWSNVTGEMVQVSNTIISEINLYLSTNRADTLYLDGLQFSMHIYMEEVQDDSPDLSLDATGMAGDLEAKKRQLLDELVKLRADLVDEQPE